MYVYTDPIYVGEIQFVAVRSWDDSKLEQLVLFLQNTSTKCNPQYQND